MKLVLTIPTSLKDITLRTYQKYEKAINSNLTEQELLFTKISILCDVPIDHLDKVEMNEISAINDMLNYALNMSYPLTRIFKLNGVEYGFIPNIEKITFGEYVDLDTYIQSTENLHKTMALLYRPITKKKNELYDITKYTGEEDYNAMLDVTMDIVTGALFFFYTLGLELLKLIPSYLEKVMDPMNPKSQPSEKNGVGFQVYMDLLKEKFTALDKLLN